MDRDGEIRYRKLRVHKKEEFVVSLSTCRTTRTRSNIPSKRVNVKVFQMLAVAMMRLFRSDNVFSPVTVLDGCIRLIDSFILPIAWQSTGKS